MDVFKKELTELLNRHSKENGSNTPDYVLADYLIKQLQLFDDHKNGKSKVDDSVLKDFTNDLLLELKAQDLKWGADRQKHPLEWQSILIEEVGEVAQEINDNSFASTLPKVYELELVQVAACTFRMYQQNRVNLFGLDHKKGY